MRVIAIAGKMGSGKSTVASMLAKHAEARGLTVEIIPFAKPLKDLATQIGWDGEKDSKGRRLLQLLGTDVCRDCIDKDYWAKRWRTAAEASEADIVIVDDVRFDNEAEALVGLMYKMILIAKPIPWWTAAWAAVTSHASEQWVPRTPHYVLEHTALTYLDEQVRTVLTKILGSVR